MMENDKPPALNTVDLVLTVLTTFFWLTAASALAWAKGQLVKFTTQEVSPFTGFFTQLFLELYQ